VSINQQLSITRSTTGKGDTNDNYLGGVNTHVILYRFIYTDTNLGCSTPIYDFTAVPPFCNADSATYDYECNDCSSACGNYGCVQDSPLKCWTSTCPPSSYSDSTCLGCYANSHKKSGEDVCECDTGITKTADYPLTCQSKLHSACSGALLTTLATSSSCSSCYANSIEGGGTCVCDSGSVQLTRSTTSLTCISKA
jgi:hypothetical protein